MTAKKTNAFVTLCKDIMISNMADTLKAYGGFPELEKCVYDLKDATIAEVASMVTIVQNVVVSDVIKKAVKQAKEQEQKNGILDNLTQKLYS